MSHAINNIRERFHELLETVEFTDTQLQEVAGKLWNCSDTVPRHYLGLLDLPDGMTYAAVVQRIRQEV